MFAGFDPQLRRDVAIKVVHPSGRDAAESEARLVREAQALARLRHPNVVEVFDVGVDELAGGRGRRRGVYIVMELVDGPSLADWLERGSHEPDEIFAMFEQAARGLVAAHQAGVVHRDFKPGNAMVAGARVKVLDFGLAREDLASASTPRPIGPISGGEESSLTRTGTVMGTPRYMAPEQHDGANVGPAADQFAWCVALWEALAGAPPYPGRNLAELAARKREGPPPLPVARGFTAAVHRVLAQGMQPDPARRHRDMDALLRALAVARRGRRRRFVAVGAIAIGIPVVVAVALARAPALPQACTDGIAPAWDRERIDALVQDLVRRPGEGWWGTSARLSARLHRFADGWAETRATVCDAAHDDMSLDERRRSLACLERGRARFDAILELLEQRTESAHHRLWSSESPAGCITEPPDGLFARSEEDEAELDDLDARLRRLIDKSGMRVTPDLETIEHVITRADALHDDALVVRGLFALGVVHGVAGQHVEAARKMQEAAWRGEASDDALLACEQLPSAIYSLQMSRAPVEDVDRLIEHTQSLLHGLDDPLDLVLDLARMRMLVVGQRGDNDGALAIGQAAVDRGLAAAQPGTERLLFDMLLMSAQIRVRLGRYPEARGDIRRALDLVPSDARWLEHNIHVAYAILGATSYMQGAEEDAIREVLAAIAHQPDVSLRNPALQGDIAFYGMILFDLGQEIEGEAHLVRARDVLVLDHGFSVSQLGTVLGNLALVQLTRHDWDAARATAEQQLEFGVGRNSTWDQAGALAYRARANLGLGRLDEAEHDIARALALDPGRVDDGALVRAELHIARAEWDDARRDALAVLESLHPARPGLRANGSRARAYWVLARIAQARDEIADAIAFAEIATNYYAHAPVAQRTREQPAVDAFVARARARR